MSYKLLRRQLIILRIMQPIPRKMRSTTPHIHNTSIHIQLPTPCLCSFQQGSQHDNRSVPANGADKVQWTDSETDTIHIPILQQDHILDNIQEFDFFE